MTTGQVKEFFCDKENVPCPLTEKLVKAGYQQISGGYIDRARWRNVKVSYKENSPSQYWHLMTPIVIVAALTILLPKALPVGNLSSGWQKYQELWRKSNWKGWPIKLLRVSTFQEVLDLYTIGRNGIERFRIFVLMGCLKK